MPRVFAGAILAHECMHAWLRLSGIGQLDPQIEEGLCQLMAVLWLGTLTPVQVCLFGREDVLTCAETLIDSLAHKIAVSSGVVFSICDDFRQSV